MKDRNDIEVIINNQRVIMAALIKILKTDGKGKHEEVITFLDERLGNLNKREISRS